VDDFDVMSSPSPPVNGLDFGLTGLGDFVFDADSFLFSEPDSMVYGSMERLSDLASPEFRIEIQGPPAVPVVNAVRRREERMPSVFRPFASVESIELAVQGLRKCIGQDVTDSKSLPLPLVKSSKGCA
jgi:hypothetical protein